MGFQGARMSFCFTDEITQLLPPLAALVGSEFEVPWDGELVPARIEAADTGSQGEVTITMVIDAPFPEVGEGLRLDLSALSRAASD